MITKKLSNHAVQLKWEPLLHALIACCAIAVLTACDPEYYVQYQIDNGSLQPIYVYSSYRIGLEPDTNYISSGAKLTLYTEFGRGRTERRMENLKSLPFEIAIFNREGQPVKRDVQDISQWSKFYTSNRKTNGVVQLRLRPQDF